MRPVGRSYRLWQIGASEVHSRTYPSPWKLYISSVQQCGSLLQDDSIALLAVTSTSIPADFAIPTSATSKHSIMFHVAGANLPDRKTSSYAPPLSIDDGIRYYVTWVGNEWSGNRVECALSAPSEDSCANFYAFKFEYAKCAVSVSKYGTTGSLVTLRVYGGPSPGFSQQYPMAEVCSHYPASWPLSQDS